jgi:chromosome partitioning protein
MNRKGGVGKTSITANLAGVLASAGYRVLAVDLDAQGNLGDDLGYRGTDLNDEGAALFDALAFGKALKPAKSIRNNLDVLPAGQRTSMLGDHLMGQTLRGEDPADSLALRLSEIADNYDVIVLDCPPGDATLQTQALIAARWILIPTQPDDGSLKGLEQLADRVVATFPRNPTLRPLGVVLFPMLTSAKRVQAEVRAKLAGIMGDIAPVFTSTIRFAQAAGVDARSRGQLAIELAQDAEGQDRFAWKKVLKRSGETDDLNVGEAPRRLADSAGSLAGDYLQLTEEVLRTLANQERLAAETTEVSA